MPIHELDKQRGTGFPVFDTPDLGSVGMLICYDMVFPEAPRCLALAGADVIFHPTLGGAAIGDAELSLAAFRTRAVENFVYIVVAQRGSGSMIISPQGKVLAEAEGQDSLAIADIDPRGGREGGDALNHQADMRARLFRERSPEAFGILTEREPPILRKAPETIGIADAVRIGAGTLTAGEDRFKAAEALARAGKRDEAVRAFEQLRRDFPHTWIDRVSRERLAQTARLRLRPGQRQTDAQSEKNPAKAETPDARLPEGRTGIAARYQGDEGIERDPAIIFVERFDEGAVEDLAKRWESVQGAETMSLSDDVPEQSTDRRSLLITHVGGQGNGGQLYRRLPPGHEQVYARFYVKFDQDCAAIHHFGTHLGGFNPPTPWPQGGAGTRPSGKGRFTTGVEPNGADWSWDFYTYWQGMHVHGDGR
ncbi:MAG: nitrilase-related carbon-nitrogen hydrolase, partial [Pirellulales bacterium]